MSESLIIIYLVQIQHGTVLMIFMYFLCYPGSHQKGKAKQISDISFINELK